MVRDILDPRSTNWVARREEVKDKSIGEIHSEAEKNCGLRPGATASMRNNRGTVPSGQGSISPISPGGFPINRMMPRMPRVRNMPEMPGIDNDNWVVPRSRSMQRGNNIQPIQPASHGQPPLIGKSPSMNSKFLPQGSGALIGGTRTVSFAKQQHPPVCLPILGYGVDPTSQVTAAVKAAPPAAEKIIPLSGRMNPEVFEKKTISNLEECFSVQMLEEALQ